MHAKAPTRRSSDPRTWKGPARVLSIVVAATLFSAQARTQEVPSLEEMWRIIQQQQAEIDALKAENRRLRDEEAAPAATAGAAAAKPSTTILIDEPIASNEREEEPVVPSDSDVEGATSITFAGHAMLDMGYQTNQSNPDWFDVLRPTKLPSFDNEYGDDGKFYSSVRQSRLGVSTHTPTALGDVKTLIEFELFGVGDDAGQTTFRLRHAWGEIGQFGAGQYWSAFMDIDVFPNSIEYWGPNAMVLYRNVQARWTPWKNEAGSRFAISLERPGGSGGESELDSIIDRDNIEPDLELPDLAAHYRHSDDWGHVQLAGILRQIRWADTGDDELDLSGEETGWGLNLSTNLRLGPHVFRGSLVHGQGIQNYMNDANADIGVVLTPNIERPFRGEAIPLTGVVAFLDLNWSDQWTSTVGYAIQINDLPALSTPQSFEKGEYALANLLYHPHPRVFLGPEIQWGRRENFNGFSADDLRLQFSAKYSFSKSLITR
jgi:hypothetical protein